MSRTLTAEFTTGTMKQERGSEWKTILADWFIWKFPDFRILQKNRVFLSWKVHKFLS